MRLCSVAHFSLIFNSHRDHLILHSFPTRRSSDLIFSELRAHVTHLPQLFLGKLAVGGFLLEVRGEPRTSRRKRSEEHTSELQSQSNLVCRPLLEKNKI